MSPPRVHHPIFARLWGRLSHVVEREIGADRQEMLAGLSGRVLEVGAGNGMNFAHYPAEVSEVVAIEPEPYLRRLAEQAAAAAPLPVRVLDGVAESVDELPGPFDAVVFSLVLCTVADVPSALSAARRVLAPSGELRFFEHVAAERPAHRRMQRLADASGVWPLLAGGCHCSRDTVAAIRAAGFAVERVRSFAHPPDWSLTNPMVIGVARPMAE